jgi:protein-S-isoprenylcysteine O-methyltransferase Ste14
LTKPLSPRAERSLQTAIDLGERLFVLLLFATFAVRLSHSLGIRPYNLLALLSEALVATFILIRRTTDAVTMRPLDWVVALAGTALPMTVRAGGQPLLPPFAGTVLMFAGLSLAVWAKAILRRSFGIAAANRGAVSSGPYRLIRHPMYAGYFLVFAGFLLNNPSIWNLAIYLLAVVCLIVRIFAEEIVLTNDPTYAAYRQRVRYRLAPGVL